MLLTVPMLALAAALWTTPVAAMPASDANAYPECAAGCIVDGVCHPAGEWWSDASKPGCRHFTCHESTSYDDGKGTGVATSYNIAALTCPAFPPIPKDVPHVVTPGNDSLPYPDCCPKIIVTRDPKKPSLSVPPALYIPPIPTDAERAHYIGEQRPAVGAPYIGDQRPAVGAPYIGDQRPAVGAPYIGDQRPAMEAHYGTPAVGTDNIGDQRPAVPALYTGKPSPTVAAPSIGEPSPAVGAPYIGASKQH